MSRSRFEEELGERLTRLTETLEHREATEVSWSKEKRGYFATLFVWSLLPHKKPDTNTWVVDAGDIEVTFFAPDTTGLPYGSIPRTIVYWLSTQIKKSESDRIALGRSYDSFLTELGYGRSGGKSGPRTRVMEQLRKLGDLAIKVEVKRVNKSIPFEPGHGKVNFINHWLLWDDEGAKEGEPHIEMSGPVARSMRTHSMPLSVEHLRELRRSPLAIDLFMELVLRAPMVKEDKPLKRPWYSMMRKYGRYETTPNGKSHFIAEVEKALRRIQKIYPKLKWKTTHDYLIINKSPYLYPPSVVKGAIEPEDR